MDYNAKIEALKKFIYGKMKGNPELKYKVTMNDGLQIVEFTDTKQIPDFSVLDDEIFMDSEFIKYEIFIEDSKVKAGYLKEPKQTAAPVQQNFMPRQQQQAQDFSGLEQMHKMQMEVMQNMIAHSSQANKQTLDTVMASMKSVIDEMKKSSEDFAKQTENNFNLQIEHAFKMAREENKFEVERLKLQYDTGKIDWMELIGAAEKLLPNAIDLLMQFKQKTVNR